MRHALRVALALTIAAFAATPAAVTEYFDRFSAYGADWLTVLTTVDDPKYLSQQYLTSTHFKREPDASKFSPSPCEPAALSR